VSDKIVQRNPFTSSKKLLISALFLSNLVLYIPSTITSLLLIEIGLSFDIEVGVAGQVNSVNYIASAIMGAIMGVLSVKYGHKSLLLIGLAVLCLSALSCFTAPNFIILLICYSLAGISKATVTPMSNTIVGRYFTLEQRPKVVGYLLAGMIGASVIGPPIISYIGDWRLSFLLFALPPSILTFFLAIIGVPSTQSSNMSTKHKYLEGYRQVFKNRSAVACIVGNIFVIIGAVVLGSYGITFYRQRWLLDTAFISYLFTGLSLIYLVSFLFGGRIVNKFGRKTLTVVNAFLYGVLILSFMNVPNLVLSLILWLAAGLVGSLRLQAYSNLILEQIPEYRGTMMSLNQLSWDLSWGMGNVLAGLILIAFDYEYLSLFGILIIIGAAIFHVFTTDPTKTQVNNT